MESALSQSITVPALTVVAYASTNTDNLLLAVLLLGGQRANATAVLAGVLTAALAVIGLCALALPLRAAIDVDAMGFLGLIPLALGVRQLLRDGASSGDTFSSHDRGQGFAAVWLNTSVLLVANSADTVALFLPLLAESSAGLLPVLALSYLLVAICWAFLALGLASNRALTQRLERHGARLMPWVMIGMGVYILLDTATDSLL